MLRRSILAAAATALVIVSLPSSASAATQIGETFVPGTGCSDAKQLQLQTTSPGSLYAAPTAGVITSWSFLSSATPAQLKLKVARPAGGNDFTIVGDSPLETSTPSVLNTYTDVRIPVQAGDVIGFYEDVATGRCGEFAPPGYATHVAFGSDVPPGTTTTFIPAGFHLDVSAALEPDADNDGFGDETQDECPGEAGVPDNGCPVPDTQITNGPKDRTKKKRATFAFSASSPGATFECSLDGGPFAPCSSPDTIKVKKGKHTFSVRATVKGHTDSSPASDDWKVKKKRK